MLFTIFTPTYNRAYILPKLYSSLLNQVNQNFQWLIVDDGSTDNTEMLIKEYITENKISIRYFKQKNQGKHIAINKAIGLAKLPWFCIIDSDDYLESDATQVWEQLTHEVNDNETAGFSFIHFSDRIIYDKSKYGNQRMTNKDEYVWEFKGEMLFCFKTQVLKKFSFPVYPEEKFCQESVLFLPILRNYQMIFTDYVLVRGEYLEDGLSQNHYLAMIKNPKYGLLSVQEKMKSARTKKDKEYLADVYWDIVLKSKKIPLTKAVFGIPLKWTVETFKRILIKKLKSK